MHDYLKAPYRDCPKDPWDLPDHPPALLTEISEAHPELPRKQVASTCWMIVGDWLVWGAQFAATATPDQRQKIIKAVMLVETDGLLGLSNHDYREMRQYEAFEFWCNSMDGEALALHCERVISEAAQDGDELLKFMAAFAKSKPGPKKDETGFEKQTRALIPRVDEIIAAEGLRSDWAACKLLAERREIPGYEISLPESLARRLYGLVREHRRHEQTQAANSM